MLSNLNAWELLTLALLALFIFGPERLPKFVSDAVRMLRSLRSMARNATQDLSRELGTEVRLEDLNPKTFIRNHILSDEEQQALRRPFDDLTRDVRGVESDVRRAASGARPIADRRRTPADPAEPGDGTGPGVEAADENSGRHRADPDAT